jgi:hypothetical protein
MYQSMKCETLVNAVEIVVGGEMIVEATVVEIAVTIAVEMIEGAPAVVIMLEVTEEGVIGVTKDPLLKIFPAKIFRKTKKLLARKQPTR